jgi:hypothetical protein
MPMRISTCVFTFVFLISAVPTTRALEFAAVFSCALLLQWIGLFFVCGGEKRLPTAGARTKAVLALAVLALSLDFAAGFAQAVSAGFESETVVCGEKARSRVELAAMRGMASGALSVDVVFGVLFSAATWTAIVLLSAALAWGARVERGDVTGRRKSGRCE